MPGRKNSFFRRMFIRAKQMFHLLIGIAFLFLSMAGVTVSLKLWQEYQKMPSNGVWTFGTVATFSVLLFFFSLYSFAKARSVR